MDWFDVKVNRIEDQDEPHVHVYEGGIEYRISLVTGLVMTYGGRGTSTKAQGRAAERLPKHIEECWTEWNKWHRRNSQVRSRAAHRRMRR